MEEFPGIVFRTGPTGRRAGVAGGPDDRVHFLRAAPPIYEESAR
jgi:hypothetical protein